MTWVIAAAPLLGAYAVAVSDTQVTFTDGTTADILQKTYPVGPFLIGGFAGSVRIGFALLESISSFLWIPPEESAGVAWDPTYVAESWGPIAREVFQAAAAGERAAGAQFILAGPHPTADIAIPGRAMPYIVRFNCPTFEPQIATAGNALSIGSGAAVPAYRDGIQEIMSVESGALQAEVGNTGGWAFALNLAVTTLLEDHPIGGIGPHVHVHVAYRGGFSLSTNDREIHPPNDAPPIEFKMPPVAHSWAEFSALSHGITADVNAATA